MKNHPALSQASGLRASWPSLLRLAFLLACFFVITGFDACNDDPLLDPEGGSGCAGSHCSARVLPDTTSNPVVF